jgi:hypothetical protein
MIRESEGSKRMRTRSSKQAWLFLGIVPILMIVGCQSKRDTPFPAAAPSQTLNIPPKQLLVDVKKIVTSPPISLPIESESEGKLITGYQSFRGDWHILRYWQERTRYIIEVVPDFNDPAGRSQLQVTAQTQQRAASNQTYDDAPELDRRDRAAKLLSEIQAGLLAK